MSNGGPLVRFPLHTFSGFENLCVVTMYVHSLTSIAYSLSFAVTSSPALLEWMISAALCSKSRECFLEASRV